MTKPISLHPDLEKDRDDITNDVDRAIAKNPTIAKIAAAVGRIEAVNIDEAIFSDPGYKQYAQERREYLQDSKGMPAGEARIYASEHDGRGTIELYDPIDMEPFGVSAKTFVAQMEDFRSRGILDLDIRLNSPGGDVFDGVAIYNRLVQWPGNVDVYVDSIAASAASIVAMAGKRIYIAETAEMMVHSPWTFTGGNARKLRQVANVLDRVQRNLIKAYQRRTGLDETKIVALLEDDESDEGDGTTMSAEEAVDLGFADEVLAQEQRIAACADMGRFRALLKANNVSEKVATPFIKDAVSLADLSAANQEMQEAIASFK